jgi:hypothetical protein
VQNIYSYHLIIELEGLQPSGRYIHEQMYIACTIITWNSIPPAVRLHEITPYKYPRFWLVISRRIFHVFLYFERILFNFTTVGISMSISLFYPLSRGLCHICLSYLREHLLLHLPVKGVLKAGIACTIITWNSIPPAVRQASTICQFQAGLGSIILPMQSQM